MRTRADDICTAVDHIVGPHGVLRKYAVHMLTPEVWVKAVMDNPKATAYLGRFIRAVPSPAKRVVIR